MATATIARDRPCIKCKYNLRELDASGNCPECGVPIQETLAHYPSRPRSRYHYTYRLCIIAPTLYLVWVGVGLLIGGKGGAFFAVDAFYPLAVVFRLFGVESFGVVGGLLMFYIGGPLLYAGLGALLGCAIDTIRDRSR